MYQNFRTQFLTTLLAALVTPAAWSDPHTHDGILLDSTIVTLTPVDIKTLQPSSPDIESILETTELRSITYLSDGLKVKGYLAMPKKGEKLPCVISNRGGNRELSAWTDARAASALSRIASWGYVVVASQYRGNAGGEGKEEFGGKDVDDVLNLIPLLKSLPQADATRIGMCGYSRGGMMTYEALTRTDKIAAAVIGFGLADAPNNVAQRPEMERVFAELVPDYNQNKSAALEGRSAIRWPEKLNKTTPILLLHGTADWRVDPMDSIRMATALYQLKHPFRLVLFEGGAHGLPEHTAEVRRITKDWLDHYVRDRQPWPSLKPHGD
jgi:dipeptidyl aminopeptidase/acylaminoacyl peptidase